MDGDSVILLIFIIKNIIILYIKIKNVEFKIEKLEEKINLLINNYKNKSNVRGNIYGGKKNSR